MKAVMYSLIVAALMSQPALAADVPSLVGTWTGQRDRIANGKTSKSFEEMLERPDIDDMFFAPYPAGSTPGQPAKSPYDEDQYFIE